MTDDEIAEGWEGIMLTYTEQDWPGAPRYPRTIPGWKCRRCSRCFGTSGPPPSSHDCVGVVRPEQLVGSDANYASISISRASA